MGREAGRQDWVRTGTDRSQSSDLHFQVQDLGSPAAPALLCHLPRSISIEFWGWGAAATNNVAYKGARICTANRIPFTADNRLATRPGNSGNGGLVPGGRQPMAPAKAKPNAKQPPRMPSQPQAPKPVSAPVASPSRGRKLLQDFVEESFVREGEKGS